MHTFLHKKTDHESIKKWHLYAESIKGLGSIISIPTSYKAVTHAFKANGPSCFIYSGISGDKFNSCKPQQWKPCSHMSHMTTSVTIVTCIIIKNISQQRGKVSQKKGLVYLYCDLVPCLLDLKSMKDDGSLNLNPPLKWKPMLTSFCYLVWWNPHEHHLL